MSFEVSPLFLSVYQGFFETINPLVVAKSFQQRQQLQLLSTHLCQLLNFHFFILNFPHISHLPFFLTLSSSTFATRCRLHVVFFRVWLITHTRVCRLVWRHYYTNATTTRTQLARVRARADRVARNSAADWAVTSEFMGVNVLRHT